jgi:transcriptional regulator with XRE-family HTH domain
VARTVLVRDRQKHALLGQYIRDTRASAGMTQAMLAAALAKPQSYIAKIESGERRIDILEFIQICEAMNVNVNGAINYIKEEILSC